MTRCLSGAIAAVILLASLSGSAASPDVHPTAVRQAVPRAAYEVPRLRSGPPCPQPEQKASIAAIGDVLIHRSIYDDARTKSGFDFRPMFEKVRPALAAADVTVANQESITGGIGIGLSDYPTFNSPFETADALRDAGVDVVTMANNHTLDRGEKAVLQAIGHWRDLQVEYAGASESVNDRRRMRLVKRNGLKLAFLSYTYGTNGIPSPPGKSHLVHRLEPGVLTAEIREAKRLADAVVVSLHFGVEYQRLPNDEQKRLAKLAAVSGADLILGHHPHVLQPLEWIDNGRNGGRSLVVYSLGNFIAAQKQSDPHTRIGGILSADLQKVPGPGPEAGSIGSRIVVENVTFLPTYIRFKRWRGYRVVPLASVTEEELKDAPRVFKEVAAHMRRWMPDLTVADGL
ncbi:CapA family protein [Paenibacillus validus]|uniref:CapA family protein n=1 Tax=Paenibacillus TaxID=44249 RepID=UPI000FDA96A0|nr:CapA family protein [Paenibacillus validus]MED4603370.1 CapA family protein [Paenibacillus validus]MED4607961.1 CapA family protein [Paenibacillus validus]